MYVLSFLYGMYGIKSHFQRFKLSENTFGYFNQLCPS